MNKLLRYADLKARGIFNSRMTLKRQIDAGEFPTGRLITPNRRAWTPEEVEEYHATRPATRKRQEPAPLNVQPDSSPVLPPPERQHAAPPGRQRCAGTSARPPPKPQPAS
jgi:hypothetical protein